MDGTWKAFSMYHFFFGGLYKSSYRKDGNTIRIATLIETQLLSMTDKTWKTHIRNLSGLVKTEKVVKLTDKK